MDPALAAIIMASLGAYLAVGLVFALIFVSLLIKRFDPNAGEAAPIQFRLLILPGVMALWPLMALLFLKRLAAPAKGGHA